MVATGHVEEVDYQGRRLFIVGTAHVSAKSVEEVQRVIEEVRPDTVCVELDETRYRALVDESQWRKLDIFQVIRQKKVLFLLVSMALAAYQRKLGERLGVKPGAELVAATAYGASKASGSIQDLTLKLGGAVTVGQSVFASHDQAAGAAGTYFLFLEWSYDEAL